VYVRGHFAALPTAILARVAGAVVVQEFNGPLEDALDAWPGLRPLRGPLSIVTRAQIRWADTVVVVTEGLRLHWRDRSGRQAGYQVIGNGANVEQFRPASSAGPPGSRPSVVFVGALAPWQGIDTVLAATEALGWPSGVDLVIAGDGMERHKVEAAATSNPRIRWLGAIPYSQAASVVAGSLAAVVPVADVPRSRYGLSPLKLFEAMACGVPVVASDLPGLGDIVRAHDCGLTFPAGDPNALARSVAELAADPARAREMGSRGRDAAVAYYSWDARAGQTEEVLLLAAARRRAGGRSTRHGRSAS
jgi:glycosyltransferase involved in cell wall biosynthesis